MRRLNARYRRKRDVAEVLAFRYPGGTPRGQIFILHRPGTNDPATRARLLVHAMVHLKGYDHRTRHARARMEQEEARVLRYLSRQRRQHSTQTV
jgi:ssRNA-specific RNase YbeY (16S rRNA maturation enzyme)